MSKPSHAGGLPNERPEFLSTKQAARFLGYSVPTLNRHRCAGTGPKFYRQGRNIKYRIADLLAWGTKNPFQSTSQYSDAE